MSVAAVKVYKDKIVLAADSQIATSDICKKEFNDAKIYKGIDYMFASTGEASEISLFTIFCKGKSPSTISIHNETALLHFFRQFIEFKNEFKPGCDELENDYLFVYENKAFMIGSDLYIKHITDYQAIGAGMSFAEAILWAGFDVEYAIKSACALSPFCDEPVVKYDYFINGDKTIF